MCDMNLCNELENGGGNSMQKQSLALSKIMQAQDAQGKTMQAMAKRLEDIPDRTEVQQMVDSGLGIHIKTCADARPKPAQPEPVEFHLGKGGLEMKGRAAMLAGSILGGAVVFFLVKAIPYIKEWVALWKGGTP